MFVYSRAAVCRRFPSLSGCGGKSISWGGGGGGEGEGGGPLLLNKEAEKEWGARVRVVQPETPTSLCFADSLLARPLTEDRQTGK